MKNRRWPSFLLGFGLLVVFGITTDQIMHNVYDSANTALRVNLVAGGSPASSTPTPLTFGTPGVIAVFAATELGSYPGAACTPPALALSQSAAGAWTCATPVPGAAQPTATPLAFGTPGVIPVFAVAELGASTLTDNTTSLVSGNTTGFGSKMTNEGVTGTTTNKLVKQSNATALIVATTDVGGVLGICDAGCGTTGSASIITSGPGSCVFDNAVTQGHYFSNSTSVTGDCTDSGTAVVSGAATLGIITNANAVAGTRTVWFNGPDSGGNVTNIKGGGGKVGQASGNAGAIQVSAGGGQFASDAGFTADVTNHRLVYSSLAPVTSGTPGVMFSGTIPANLTAYTAGVEVSMTSAGATGTPGPDVFAFRSELLSGYTGGAATGAATFENNAAGTSTGLNLNVASTSTGNLGMDVFSLGVGAGTNVAVAGDARGSSNESVGVYGKSNSAVAGTNVGVLANAANSTEGTGPKNIALLSTLTTTDPAAYSSLNGSYAGFFDGGTLPDATSRALKVVATLASSSSILSLGTEYTINGAGSNSQAQYGMFLNFLSGYTGSSSTRGIAVDNANAGTGNTLALGSTASVVANFGGDYQKYGSTTGLNIGLHGYGYGSTGTNVGLYGRGTATAAGQNIGVLGTAAGSTEGTDFKNLAGVFSLHTALPSASNTSVALIADGAGNDEIRGYNAGTQNFSVASTGAIATSSTITSSATGALGWSTVAGANTACNTTCTSACVMGFASAATGSDPVSCTDATADNCLCAGAS